MPAMKIPTARKAPAPLFDAIEHIHWKADYQHAKIPHEAQDYRYARDFLHCYKDNEQTFNAYRREIERFLSWYWFMVHTSLLAVRRPQFEAYLQLCQSPPLAWIGLKNVPRFIDKNGQRIPNRNGGPS